MVDWYFARARLRRDAPVHALVDVFDPQDAGQAINVRHKLIWTLFARSDRGVDDGRAFLWRYDQGQFLILSSQMPEDEHGVFDLDVKSYEPEFSKGQRLRFELRANAVVARKPVFQDGEEKSTTRRSRRHDVVMDRMRALEQKHPDRARADLRDLARDDAGTKWLARCGEQGGFTLSGCDRVLYQSVRIPRVRSRRFFSLGILDFSGELTIDDPVRFLDSQRSGYGKAKAFGCGLMLLMRC